MSISNRNGFLGKIVTINCSFYRYVKFHMLNNSFYGVSNWHDLIAINGFDINGDFVANYSKFRK